MRGRADAKGESNSTLKDGKGNVIVSVRVRPDVGTKDRQQDVEWEVDNKRALVSYKGREGGDYIYGRVVQNPRGQRI